MNWWQTIIVVVLTFASFWVIGSLIVQVDKMQDQIGELLHTVDILNLELDRLEQDTIFLRDQNTEVKTHIENAQNRMNRIVELTGQNRQKDILAVDELYAAIRRLEERNN